VDISPEQRVVMPMNTQKTPPPELDALRLALDEVNRRIAHDTALRDDIRARLDRATSPPNGQNGPAQGTDKSPLGSAQWTDAMIGSAPESDFPASDPLAGGTIQRAVDDVHGRVCSHEWVG
jgi:hypothetical protein